MCNNCPYFDNIINNNIMDVHSSNDINFITPGFIRDIGNGNDNWGYDEVRDGGTDRDGLRSGDGGRIGGNIASGAGGGDGCMEGDGGEGGYWDGEYCVDVHGDVEGENADDGSGEGDGGIIYENENESDKDPGLILSELRSNNIGQIIIAHLNINFLQNKYEALKLLIQDNIDIIMLSETKIDDSFTSSQFTMEGYSTPFRLDRNCFGGGIAVYTRSDIPCKEIKTQNLPGDIESLFIEINLHNTKWLLICGYNPHKEHISYFLSQISKSLDTLISKYDNLLIIGDFNSEISEEAMNDFSQMYNLKNLIKEPTCFKNPNNPSSIDIMLTNHKNSFHGSSTVETGLSDHHKMTVTVLKHYFNKKKPQIINYRCYKYFDESKFRNELINNLQNFNEGSMDYDKFKEIFMKILDMHAPKKKKVIRGNNAPFMNKDLTQAFMHRSKLKNKFNKNPTEKNRLFYNKQRNFCVSLVKKEKKKYYNNLDLKIFNDNKKFWKRIKPLFSEKQKDLQRDIILVDNDKIISDKQKVAEKLNNFFIESVENLDIEHFTDDNENISPIINIQDIIKRYESHPSILKIKQNVKVDNNFVLKDITPLELKHDILQLDKNKASIENDIPTKVLIGSNDIVSGYLSDIYNKSLKDHCFPNSLKLADVIPIHKKDDRTLMKNYRPVSLLPIGSKLFERQMYNQFLTHIDEYLSPYIFGFRKGHSTEQCLTIMMEGWKKALDEKRFAGAILTDLSKAFDCLSHDLLIAKLEAYGFNENSLKYIYSYLKDRKQRTKIESSYSTWKELKCGVPQGSILGPLLFNIFINDIFYFINETRIANYADDNTVHAISDNIQNLLNILETETNVILKWFKVNEMKPNGDKSHLIVANDEKSLVKLGNDVIIGETSVVLLGVTIDNKLNFNEHVTKLIKKGNQKLYALARISKYLNNSKLKIIMKTFVQSQFNYCPLLWMNHNRILNNKINKLHERALRIVYKNDNFTFQELLDMDNSVTVHQRNLQKLATEMFKIKHHLSPLPMQEIFIENVSSHELRNNRNWEITKVRTVFYGTETIRYRGPKTWEIVPKEIKEAKTITEFKAKIKHWRPTNCTCRLCKIYIHNLGFIN